MSDPSTSSPSGGVSRFVGVGLSLVTGFVVFTVGVSLFPIEPPLPPEPARRTVIAQAATPASPPEPSPSPAGGGGASAAPEDGAAPPPTAAAVPDGGERPAPTGRPSGDKRERAEMKPAAVAPAKVPAPSARAEDASAGDAESAPAAADAGADGSANGSANGGASGSASADEADGGAQSAPVADCTQSDKDIAREAWRHNWPTVCPVADSKKAFLIIPVKGSIDNAASELKRKPIREARVTLPSGESPLSLKQYKLRRLGFRDLKIGPPDDGSGTRFRVRFMNGAGDPAFEIKDGYAKITVLTPSE
jgi:hypothetical protein